jgi:hypothetical protein
MTPKQRLQVVASKLLVVAEHDYQSALGLFRSVQKADDATAVGALEALRAGGIIDEHDNLQLGTQSVVNATGGRG